ncbi:unnamed protein product [Mytilus coruscus]|uniref:DDE Tnp4 domain-containing protein n=1 Tax=Mytilus coruscus TaxID=42192 RepID=A0A6J8EAF1_MYTCO|nr:unnamed protein product [Mytilus coruscus]
MKLVQQCMLSSTNFDSKTWHSITIKACPVLQLYDEPGGITLRVEVYPVLQLFGDLGFITLHEYMNCLLVQFPGELCMVHTDRMKIVQQCMLSSTNFDSKTWHSITIKACPILQLYDEPGGITLRVEVYPVLQLFGDLGFITLHEYMNCLLVQFPGEMCMVYRSDEERSDNKVESFFDRSRHVLKSECDREGFGRSIQRSYQCIHICVFLALHKRGFQVDTSKENSESRCCTNSVQLDKKFHPKKSFVHEITPNKKPKLQSENETLLDSISEEVNQEEDIQESEEQLRNPSLVGIASHGALIFISSLYTGSMSDVEKALTKHCGLVELLDKGDSIMADKGIVLNNVLSVTGITVNTSPFLMNKGQFTKQEVEETQTIARLRIHVGRHIIRLKEFHLFGRPIPLSIVGSINQIWTVANILTLFRGPLVKQLQ